MENIILDLLDFSKIFENMKDINVNGEILDLAKKEDLDKFNEYLDDVECNEFAKVFLEHITGKEISELRKLAKKYYDANNIQKTPVHKIEIDHSLKDIKKTEESKPSNKFERPSENIDVNVGLQIHKLVQEYIDTKVKPYAKGLMDEKSINDAYAGLYEFACWIYKK